VQEHLYFVITTQEFVLLWHSTPVELSE